MVLMVNNKDNNQQEWIIIGIIMVFSRDNDQQEWFNVPSGCEDMITMSDETLHWMNDMVNPILAYHLKL